MRVVAGATIGSGDADAGKQSDGTGGGLLAADAGMAAQPLPYLLADREQRIEARHRLLEDHADLSAAQQAHLPLACLDQILGMSASRTE